MTAVRSAREREREMDGEKGECMGGRKRRTREKGRRIEARCGREEGNRERGEVRGGRKKMQGTGRRGRLKL